MSLSDLKGTTRFLATSPNPAPARPCRSHHGDAPPAMRLSRRSSGRSVRALRRNRGTDRSELLDRKSPSHGNDRVKARIKDRGVQAAEFASNTQRQRAILAQLMQHARLHSDNRHHRLDFIAAARRHQGDDQRHRSGAAYFNSVAPLPGSAFPNKQQRQARGDDLVFTGKALPSIAASNLPGEVRLAAIVSIRPAVSLEDNGGARRYSRHEQFEVRSSAVVLPFANRPQAFEWPVRSPQFGDEGG